MLLLSTLPDFVLSYHFSQIQHTTVYSIMPTEIHVGTPPRKYKHEEALQVELCTVNFHNFRGLPYEEDIDSPQFKCFGRLWKLQIRNSSEAQLGAHLILDKSRSAHKISGDFIIRITESPSRPTINSEKFPFDMDFIEENDDVDKVFGLPNMAFIDHSIGSQLRSSLWHACDQAGDEAGYCRMIELLTCVERRISFASQ